MADHVNINEPEGRFGSQWDHMAEVEKLKAELKVVGMERDQYRSDLEAIFTRIARGDDVELRYANRQIITLRAPPSDEEGL